MKGKFILKAVECYTEKLEEENKTLKAFIAQIGDAFTCDKNRSDEEIIKDICDRSGNEITSESYVHDKELCRDCQLELDKWLTEKPSSENELTNVKSLMREMFERERTLKATYLSSDGIKGVAWKVWDDTETNEIKDKLWEAVNK